MKMVRIRERGKVAVDGEGRSHGVLELIQKYFCLAMERKAEFKRQRRGKQTNGLPGDSR